VGFGPSDINAAIRDQPLAIGAPAEPIVVPHHHHKIRAIVANVIGDAVRDSYCRVAIDFREVVPDEVHSGRRVSVGLNRYLSELLAAVEMHLSEEVGDEVSVRREQGRERRAVASVNGLCVAFTQRPDGKRVPNV
jgi:hypothetical protein